MKTKTPASKEQTSTNENERTKNDQSIITHERYQLQKFLGSGATGRVYLAEDTLLEMPVAIKILSYNLVKNNSALADFKREVRLAMGLSNPHIVKMYNLERKMFTYFSIMEYVDGKSINELLGEKKTLPLEFVNGFIDVCSEAIAHAHRHGISHNDLKPANIMMDKEGLIKIIDFGTASLIHARQNLEYIAGTPDYMSPEQIRGEKLDERTDIYSMGIIAYELITGKTPYPQNISLDDLLELKKRQLTEIPDPLAAVLNNATRYDRNERTPEITIFSEEFKKLMN